MRVSSAGPLLRRALGRAALFLGGRRAEIRRLYLKTAEAFGVRPSISPGLSADRLLADYARFTRRQSEAALDRGDGLQVLERRLYRTALGLGIEYRRKLAVKDRRDAMRSARLIYGGLGIDFTCGVDGGVEIRRCAFAAFYTPGICALVSALDRGLMAGLTRGGRMEFSKRLTEGASSCRACVRGGLA